VRQLGNENAAVEVLTLPKVEHIHEFSNIEDVADTPDKDYCLPKVGLELH
jgi:hypothetical protein